MAIDSPNIGKYMTVCTLVADNRMYLMNEEKVEEVESEDKRNPLGIDISLFSVLFGG